VPNQQRVRRGSWPCENDLGSPKSPTYDPRIGQEDRREQFFPVGPNELKTLAGDLEQPWNSQMCPCEAVLALLHLC
jgi:hypothetical protein